MNVLYNGNSTPPVDGDEDWEVWTELLNVAISIWEKEEGTLWRELYSTLASAADGDKTTTANDYSYDCPTDFVFPVGFVRTISNSISTYFVVINPDEVQLQDDTQGRWCYFTGNTSTGYDLHFNPDLTLTTGDTIAYEYYKTASAVSTGTDKFEMSDPMFAVYYALAELKKDEGDTSGFTIATQKLEAMKTLNNMAAEFQESTLLSPTGSGFNT